VFIQQVVRVPPISAWRGSDKDALSRVTRTRDGTDIIQVVRRGAGRRRLGDDAFRHVPSTAEPRARPA